MKFSGEIERTSLVLDVVKQCFEIAVQKKSIWGILDPFEKNLDDVRKKGFAAAKNLSSFESDFKKQAEIYFSSDEKIVSFLTEKILDILIYQFFNFSYKNNKNTAPLFLTHFCSSLHQEFESESLLKDFILEDFSCKLKEALKRRDSLKKQRKVFLEDNSKETYNELLKRNSEKIQLLRKNLKKPFVTFFKILLNCLTAMKSFETVSEEFFRDEKGLIKKPIVLIFKIDNLFLTQVFLLHSRSPGFEKPLQ